VALYLAMAEVESGEGGLVAGSREFAQARAAAKTQKSTLDLKGKLREVMLGNFDTYMDTVVVS